MCKLYLSAPRELLEVQFGVHPPADCVEGEVQPHGRGMLIRSGDFGLDCVAANWGDVGVQERSAACPSSPGLSCLTTTISAGVVADHPATRAAWRWGQRCLVPAAWWLSVDSKRRIASRQGLVLGGGDALALAGVWVVRPRPANASARICFSMITIPRPHCSAECAPCKRPQPCANVVAIARKDWVDWLEGSDRAARGVMHAAAEADDLAPAINGHGRPGEWTTAAIDRREQGGLHNVLDDRRAMAMTEDSLH